MEIDQFKLNEDLKYIKKQVGIESIPKISIPSSYDKNDSKGKWAQKIAKDWVDESTRICKEPVWTTFHQVKEEAVDIDLNSRETKEIIKILLAGERLASSLLLIWESYTSVLLVKTVNQESLRKLE